MSISKHLCALGAGAALLTGATAAQAFPERPINLVVPFNAGGGTDLLLRALAPHFAEAIDGDVFVSNTAGGSGTVAAGALAGQRPDGYQLGYWSITVSTIQPQVREAPYGIDSWTPICSVAASPTLFFVNADSPFETIEDVVAAVEENPGQYLYGSSGARRDHASDHGRRLFRPRRARQGAPPPLPGIRPGIAGHGRRHHPVLR